MPSGRNTRKEFGIQISLPRSTSLPRSRFLDVTQRGALRDIQKTAARETSVAHKGTKRSAIKT